MLVSLRWLFIFFILSLANVYAQEPRKKSSSLFGYSGNLPSMQFDVSDEDIACSMKSCVKRSGAQDEMGPFWANRGKKDPSYREDRLYAEEPRWVLVRRDDKYQNDGGEPFYVARGKKDLLRGDENLNEFLKFSDRAGRFRFKCNQGFTHDDNRKRHGSLANKNVPLQI